MQPIIAYHLEKLYGFEFHKGEALKHVNDGGYLSCIEPEYGKSRGLYATYFKFPKSTKGEWNIPGLLPNEKFTLNERKIIHRKRKKRWKTQNHHFGADFYILKNKYLFEEIYKPIELIYSYPLWAEKYLLSHGLTAGSTVMDLTKDDIIDILVTHGHEPDPVRSYLTGRVTLPGIPLTFSDEKRKEYLTALSAERLRYDLSQRVDIAKSLNEE